MSRMTSSKNPPAKSARRREELRRLLPRAGFDFRVLLQKPEYINASLILIAFIVALAGLVMWSRERVKVRDGQIMTETRVVRVNYEMPDEIATQAKREEARKSSPRLYRLNETYLQRLQAALGGLPKAVEGRTKLSEITPELRREFALDEAGLAELQGMSANGEATPEWNRWVHTLVNEQLARTPRFESQEYQVYSTTARKSLIRSPGEPLQTLTAEAMEMNPQAPSSRLTDLVQRVFPYSLAPYVVAKLHFDAQPTFLFAEQETAQLAAKAAAEVTPVIIKHERNDVLFHRGDTLTAEQYAEVVNENLHFENDDDTAAQRWLSRAGVLGLVAMAMIFLGGFGAMAYPRIIRNPLRLTALCALIVGMLGVSVFMTAYAPMFLYPAAIGPALCAAIIALLAYDQRMALLTSAVHCSLVTMALGQNIGFFLLLLCGCGASIAQLRELRHRNALIRAATGTALVLAVGTVALGLFELPAVPGARQQILIMTVSAALTSYGVGFLILGILPSIERLFDITTGMTLAELRDPKRPLLRQLQQKAPGTYNHSLQVASIAEAAADAIGADGLLVYVGALYHDIGKINKPEYFVENQSGGYNRHEKLSPAMSLLVIIGHVKDGIELGREYGLPRSIVHFIESHHGTTLVEYFYHAAKTKAELAESGAVEEFGYRYPGPKPRTKEAAILMLSDCVEGAARAMTEPNPGSIEGLVRRLSMKRLEDGQFDECDLTFRELTLIEDAIINRLLAIYHGRIAYPSSATSSKDADSDSPRVPAARSA